MHCKYEVFALSPIANEINSCSISIIMHFLLVFRLFIAFLLVFWLFNCNSSLSCKDMVTNNPLSCNTEEIAIIIKLTEIFGNIFSMTACLFISRSTGNWSMTQAFCTS